MWHRFFILYPSARLTQDQAGEGFAGVPVWLCTLAYGRAHEGGELAEAQFAKGARRDFNRAVSADDDAGHDEAAVSRHAEAHQRRQAGDGL
jgi:hypothetical protein